MTLKVILTVHSSEAMLQRKGLATRPHAVSRAGEGNSREFQLSFWNWDVFVCHAGTDKPFARMLRDAMLPYGLRCFVDEDSLKMACDAPSTMDHAVRNTQIAVVLLCKEFFNREAPQEELKLFLSNYEACKNNILPVFLSVTVECCEELAKLKGLEAVCKFTGVRHASERDRRTGLPVHLQATMNRIVKAVLEITGIQEAMVPV